MDYRPQSPDLGSYAPQSPDLSGGLRPQSPDLSGFTSQPNFTSQPSLGSFGLPHHQSRDRFGGAFGGNGSAGGPTSIPPTSYYPPEYQQTATMAPRSHVKSEQSAEDEYMPDAPLAKRPRGRPPGSGRQQQNGSASTQQQTIKSQPNSDPTLGVNLKTSFPVARIKRIMQADEDVGKVAQVTPHVVSRALELFMIKLISASATQARGGAQAAAGGGGGKGPKRILVQHMKKAIQSDNTFDFLQEIAAKVPDAPSKTKKEASHDSDSEEVKPKKKGKKRKESADDG